MLKSLYIKNYALIKDIRLSFEDSFITITGETGAGKSILLGALSMLLGSRADKESVRDANEKCIIEAEFDLSQFNLKSIFEKHDLDYEDITIIRREITPKKTRSFVNDTPLNLKVIQELKPYLIDIHSQNDSQLLAQSKYQYSILDAIADISDKVECFKKDLETYSLQKAELERLQKAKIEASRKQDYNQFLYDELEKAHLYAGKANELEEQFQTLQNAEDIQRLLSESINGFHQEEYGVYDQLVKINKCLIEITSSLPTFSLISDRLNSLLIESEDIVSELEDKLEHVEVNPEKLAILDTELRHINALLNKHHVNTDDELIEIKDDLEQQLQELASYDEDISNVQKKIESISNSLHEQSKLMTSKRREAAIILEQQLLDVLSYLGMKDSILTIRVNETDDYNSFGNNKLEWLFSANKGLAPKPMTKVASGGEISRIMLSIKSTLASYYNLPTIIFDEIDTGVSGEIAIKMGEIMNKMSQKMQVISITHLPQIASKGKQHLKVLKEIDNNETKTKIIELNNDERIVELSLMLGGEQNSSSAIAHAKSLLN